MERTLVAILGTLADFHREPIPYNLAALIRLVTDLKPDLLCLDITPEEWQRREFTELPPEYREALLPLAHQTDIVVVPVAGDRPPDAPTAPGWRGQFLGILWSWLAALHRRAPGPEAVNGGWRHFLADELYGVIGWLADRHRAWKAHTAHLTQQVLDLARRDPGCRVLVTVNVRYCHHLRHALKQHPEVQVVPYTQL
ncbi:MAG: hypothetical protein Fur0022_01620 [Anaerolineales bacterium]